MKEMEDSASVLVTFLWIITVFISKGQAVLRDFDYQPLWESTELARVKIYLCSVTSTIDKPYIFWTLNGEILHHNDPSINMTINSLSSASGNDEWTVHSRLEFSENPILCQRQTELECTAWGDGTINNIWIINDAKPRENCEFRTDDRAFRPLLLPTVGGLGIAAVIAFLMKKLCKGKKGDDPNEMDGRSLLSAKSLQTKSNSTDATTLSNGSEEVELDQLDQEEPAVVESDKGVVEI